MQVQLQDLKKLMTLESRSEGFIKKGNESISITNVGVTIENDNMYT